MLVREPFPSPLKIGETLHFGRVQSPVTFVGNHRVRDAQQLCYLAIGHLRRLANTSAHHLLLLLGSELATMEVRGDDPLLRFGKRPLPLHKVIESELVAYCLASSIAIATIEDHSLIKAYWLKDALSSDVVL